MGGHQFSVVLRGYDRRQVDQMVDQVRQGRQIGLDPRSEFMVSLRGYDRGEVDRFFEQPPVPESA